MDKGKGTAGKTDVSPDDVNLDVGMTISVKSVATGPPGPPLMSRMADSVSTFSQSLMGGPPSNHVLSQLSGAREKRTALAGPSSSSSSSSWSSSSRPEPLVPIRACPSAASAGAMRTTSTHDAAFAAFLDKNTTAYVSVEEGDMSSLREQEGRDGDQVVALLSALDEDLPLAHGDGMDAAPSEEDVSSLRRALFGDKVSGSSSKTAMTNWDYMLNFTPAYLGPGNDDAAREEAAEHLGTENLDEARRHWAGQWWRVLESYQDDVWGDLGDLVRDARAEVAAVIGGDDTPPEPKALLRLRSILGHLRGF